MHLHARIVMKIFKSCSMRRLRQLDCTAGDSEGETGIEGHGPDQPPHAGNRHSHKHSCAHLLLPLNTYQCLISNASHKRYLCCYWLVSDTLLTHMMATLSQQSWIFIRWHSHNLKICSEACRAVIFESSDEWHCINNKRSPWITCTLHAEK